MGEKTGKLPGILTIKWRFNFIRKTELLEKKL